ncbi:MAG TPA: TetR/AcrR family transcriptional regulator [Mycobacteriales bacterium]|nr:TetR/AcrR family transcriptional regulator [Mycobacteriales bacterium]
MTPSTAASAAPRRSRARRGDGDLLRAEILEATRRLLVERGDEELVSIRAVADAVGVTAPSIYLHFADKDALIVEVCEETFRTFDDDQEQAAAAYDDPLESLKARGRAYVSFGLANPEAYRILFMTRSERVIDLAGGSPATALAGVTALAHIVDAVRRCMDSGAFATDDPMLVALQLWTGLHGVVSLLICERGFPWPDRGVLVDRILDMQVRGLAPSSGP